MSSNTSTGTIGKICKELLVGSLKLLALCLAAVLKIAAILLEKIASLLETFSGHGIRH